MTSNLHPAHLGGRYVLLEMLGAGGMGEVYRALDPLSRQHVALKRLTTNPIQLQSNNTTGVSTTTLSYTPRIAIANEFRALSGLRHPNLISILDYGFDWGGPFFTMELLDSPRTLTQAGLLLSLEGQIRLLADVLHALTYLHRRGILHRAIKPSNTLVTTTGQVKVSDFGMALTSQEAKRRPNGVGTLAYLAPEVLAHVAHTPQSDLYAFGIMAYEMLAGIHPFDLTDRTRLLVEMMTVEPDINQIPEALRPFIQTLLAKSPSDRYPTAESALAALSTHSGTRFPPKEDAQRESLLQTATFVGREAEFTLLHKSLDRTFRTRHGAVWLIGGDSGTGKSRLVEELTVHALSGGALTLRGQASEDMGLPYHLWRETLRPLLLHNHLDDAEARILKDIIPDLTTLIGRELPDAPPTDGKNYDSQMIAVIVGLISRQTTPVVLILEDLQWTMESLMVLRALIPLVESRAIFIAATYQPELRPNLPAEIPDAKLLSLPPLLPDDVALLVQAVIGAPAPNLVPILMTETGGNTFLVIETLRALSERAGGLHELCATLPTLKKLPVSAAQVISHRLGRLPAPVLPLLRLAAVAGCAVNFNFLRSALTLEPLLPPDWTLERWMNVCASHAILEVRGNVWRFRHDRLRLAVLDHLDAETRRNLHRLTAETWETLTPYLGEEALLDMLFFHWKLSGNMDRMLETGKKLADRWSYRGWRDDSLKLLKELLEKLSDETTSRRAELLIHMGDSVLNINQTDQALTYYDKAADLAQQLNQPALIASAVYAQARVYLRVGRLEDAEQAAEKCRVIHQAGENPVGLSCAMSMLGKVADKRGEMIRAGEMHAQAVTHARESEDPDRLCAALADFGLLTLDLGETSRARESLTEALELTISHHLEYFQAVINLALAQVAQEEGYPIMALDHLNHALGLTQALSATDLLLTTLEQLAMVHLWRGDTESAQRYVQHALLLDPRSLLARLVRMNITLTQTGAVSAALDTRTLLIDAQAKGDPMLLTCAVMQVTCVRLHQGASREATRLFDSVEDIAQSRQLSRRWHLFLAPHFIQTAPLSDAPTHSSPTDSARERLNTAVALLLRPASPP